MNDEKKPKFPDYSMLYSNQAFESKKKLPPELLPTVDEIVNGLTFDPYKHRDRIVPASRDGRSSVYLHPDPIIQITFEIDENDKTLYFLHFSAPQFEVSKSIFISYSHEDEEWLGQVKKYLTVLEQQGIIEFWDDSKIKAGEDWAEKIQEALKSARAALLLVSQDFLISKFVTQVELPKLLEDAKNEGKEIFWLPVSPSTVFDTLPAITKYQSLLKNPKKALNELAKPQREKALVEMSQRIREAVKAN